MLALLQTQRLYGFVFCLGLALLFGMMVRTLQLNPMVWHRLACEAILYRSSVANATFFYIPLARDC